MKLLKPSVFASQDRRRVGVCRRRSAMSLMLLLTSLVGCTNPLDDLTDSRAGQDPPSLDLSWLDQNWPRDPLWQQQIIAAAVVDTCGQWADIACAEYASTLGISPATTDLSGRVNLDLALTETSARTQLDAAYADLETMLQARVGAYDLDHLKQTFYQRARIYSEFVAAFQNADDLNFDAQQNEHTQIQLTPPAQLTMTLEDISSDPEAYPFTIFFTRLSLSEIKNTLKNDCWQDFKLVFRMGALSAVISLIQRFLSTHFPDYPTSRWEHATDAVSLFAALSTNFLLISKNTEIFSRPPNSCQPTSLLAALLWSFLTTFLISDALHPIQTRSAQPSAAR